MRAWCTIAATLAVLGACRERKPPPSQVADRQAPSLAVPVPSPAPAAEPPMPSFAGAWQGEYRAVRHTVANEPGRGQMVAWIKDDGQQHTGAGELQFTVDRDGIVEGVATGPLGHQRLAGQWEAGGLRARLEPSPDAVFGFGGTLTCDAATAGRGTCRIQAATRDARWLREGTADIRRPQASASAGSGGGSAEPESSTSPPPQGLP